MPEGWTSSQGVLFAKCCWFSSAEFSVEVVVRQRDGQVGRALHHAHPELTERSGKLLRAFHVNRLKAYATPLQVFLRSLGREAEARPIGGGRRIRGRAALRHDVAPVEQPLQGFVDLVGGKFLFQIANDLSKAPSGRYGVRQRAVELAAKKELPVLGIEAHGIWRQHIDGEILRKLRNVFAVELWEAVIPIACQDVGTGTPTFSTTGVDHHCKVGIVLLRERHRLTRAPALVDTGSRLIGHQRSLARWRRK